MNQAVPHHTLAQHYAALVEKPTTEVLLEPARGRMGQQKLRVDKGLWDAIRELARPQHDLAEERTVVMVDEAARFVTALKENEARTAGWPEEDRAVFRRVLNLLFRHDGLVISKR